MSYQMKLALEEELRPAIENCNGKFKVKVLVHTTKTNKNGEVLCELKDGHTWYTNPGCLCFLDSEYKFEQFAWDDAESIKPITLPLLETLSEVDDWLCNH